MLILTCYRGVLLANAPISARARGGVHLGTVEEGARRRNVLLSLIGMGQDYRHQGAVALMDAGVRIEARADTPQAAGELGEMILDLLQDWTGTMFNCAVQMTKHENSMSGYDDVRKVHTYTHEFTSFYRKVA